MHAFVNIRMTSWDWMCDKCVVADAGMSYSWQNTSLSASVMKRTRGAGGLVCGVQLTRHGAGVIMLVHQI